MTKNVSRSLVCTLAFIAWTALADTRPKTPVDPEDATAVLKLGHHLRCSMGQSFLIETADGRTTPDESKYPRKTIFKDLKSKADDGDLAVHEITDENENFYFRFFMNSQIGSIVIRDKKTGFQAETDLDISDFSKPEVYVGKVQLQNTREISVTDPESGEQTPGQLTTYLAGSCQFLEGYVP
ncbi:MAG TPA: hypothetical protein VM901_12935 [Bdellovibrionota bacterium]|jgi:hypothetical protein|nr:hypothetical protein [Bdellovibrionota bacterium]